MVSKGSSYAPHENWNIDPPMSLRDYFAAEAMQAIIIGQPTYDNDKAISKAAYMMADAMLEARKK